jgi:mannose-6-phosphate isomerase
MSLSHSVFKLKGVVQNYSWGGFDFIPGLLKLKGNEGQPYAEYWMGAHPNHSAVIETAVPQLLGDFIKKDPAAVLGEAVSKRFSSLPYLFKVLDVRQMLSIQVHPTKTAAEEGFEEENRKGIAVTAAGRNYRDKNHKPELMVALSEFWLLHGFKSATELEMKLEAVHELSFLAGIFEEKGYRGLYEAIMLMDQQQVNAILGALLQRIRPLYEQNALQKDDEDFWAARAALHFCTGGDYDRGIFSIYFFNLVRLEKGEGIFQPAGMPHAYLEGRNVEVMANSDNVLRAGLTDKHIDVPELLKHVEFAATIPEILSSHSSHRIFSTPAQEFELHQYQVKERAVEVETQTGELFFLSDGAVQAATGADTASFEEGDAFFVVAGTRLSLTSSSAEASLFRVTVPAV